MGGRGLFLPAQNSTYLKSHAPLSGKSLQVTRHLCSHMQRTASENWRGSLPENSGAMLRVPCRAMRCVAFD